MLQLFIHRLSFSDVNSHVKAFIISESFFWSAWNAYSVIFGIFAVKDIPGGSIEIAATAFSTHIISRVLIEYWVEQKLNNVKERVQIFWIVLGSLIVSLSYVYIAFARSIIGIYIFYIVSGLGVGLLSPLKNAFFSKHLDKGKEVREWSLYDLSRLLFISLASALGGFVANQYGFKHLFFILAGFNTLGALPYLILLQSPKR